MMKIRLKRIGRKKQPSYRVVVSDGRKDLFGPYKEAVGFYNPRANPKEIRFEMERVKHWLAQGAQASPSVHNLLVSEGVIDAPKIKATKSKKKKAKAEADAKKEEDAAVAKPKAADAAALAETAEETKEEAQAKQAAAAEPSKEEVKKDEEPAADAKPEEAKEVKKE